MTAKWKPPGTETDPAGALAAFGVTTIPVTRLTMVDPAVSAKQQKFMAVCAHDPAHARGKCPDLTVAKAFARKPRGGY